MQTQIKEEPIKHYGIIKNKLHRALLAKRGITVTFVKRSRVLHSIMKDNKGEMVKSLDERRTVSLNDAFLSYCKYIVNKSRGKKKIEEVIIQQLIDEQHDNGSHYFLIN